MLGCPIYGLTAKDGMYTDHLRYALFEPPQSKMAAFIPLLILVIAAAYIVLGTIHLAAPTKVMPIYQLRLCRLFRKISFRFDQITSSNWKIIGVVYILFGMFLVLSLRSSF